MRHAFGIPVLIKSRFDKNQSFEVLIPDWRYRPQCEKTTETSQSIEILWEASGAIILSRKGITKAQIRLCRCAGCSSLRCLPATVRFSSNEAGLTLPLAIGYFKWRVATIKSHWLKVHSRWLKNYIFVKSVFWSAFGCSNIAFIIPSHFIIVPYLTLQGVKQFGSRSGPTFCRAWSGSKLFEEVISRRQNLPLVGKELDTEQLVDTTF